jgi:hypothetical protein
VPDWQDLLTWNGPECAIFDVTDYWDCANPWVNDDISTAFHYKIQVLFPKNCEGDVCFSVVGRQDLGEICIEDETGRINLEINILDVCLNPIEYRYNLVSKLDLEETIYFYAKISTTNQYIELPEHIVGEVIACGELFEGIDLLQTGYEPGCAEYRAGPYTTREFFSSCNGGNLIFRFTYGQNAMQAAKVKEVGFSIDETEDLNFTNNIVLSGYPISNTVCFPGGSFLAFGTTVNIDLREWPYPCEDFMCNIKGYKGGDHIITTSGIASPGYFDTNPEQSTYEISQTFLYDIFNLNWKAAVNNGPDRDAKPISTTIRLYHGCEARDILYTPPSGDTLFCSDDPADFLELTADPNPFLVYQERIAYKWIVTPLDPPGQGSFPNGDELQIRNNQFRADFPGDVQIQYKIKDIPSGYESEPSDPITLHLAPTIEITSPSNDDKFAFDDQSQGTMTIPATATVYPLQSASGLDWTITEIEGSDLIITPGGDPPTSVTIEYSNLPEDNDQFGVKYIKVAIPAYNVADSVLVKVFFDKTSDNNPEVPYPNWYFYWGEGSEPNPVVAGLPGCAYNALLIDRYGTTDTITGFIQIGPRASRIHYECSPPGGPGCYGYLINGIRFGGDHVNGVDCTAEVVAHERFHKWVVLEAWAPGGSWYTLYGGPRTTGPFGNDRDGDWLPNFYEEMVSETDPDNPDTFDISGIFHNPEIYPIGDWEYVCMIEGNGKLGDHSRDWSAGIYSKQWP